MFNKMTLREMMEKAWRSGSLTATYDGKMMIVTPRVSDLDGWSPISNRMCHFVIASKDGGTVTYLEISAGDEDGKGMYLYNSFNGSSEAIVVTDKQAEQMILTLLH